jgi:endoglucanase
MLPSDLPFPAILRVIVTLTIFNVLLVTPAALPADSAYVRVSQVGYEAGGSCRAYLMSTAAETGATFKVTNSEGQTAFSGKVGALLGIWSHSKSVSYKVYALDFAVPGGDLYRIKVSGPVSAASPNFAVDSPHVLYSGLLLNTLFFYETERDGKNYIRNALRTEPGHLKDANAHVYDNPPLDINDFVDNVPPVPPLVSAGLPNIDASGGWWDAGDYLKYVETTSYTVALMEIGIRDFPDQMGAYAPVNPPPPPGSVSFAGNSGPGAPASSDFTAEAQFGINWLMKMWNNRTKTLYYQVDNSQDWDYYGEGNPSSAASNCAGTYVTSFCLITEYDIWTVPQAADNYRQTVDPQACDPLTTFYICHRPVFFAARAGSKISPNLAGSLTADFALCYQLNAASNPHLAHQCLRNAEDIFDLADTSFPDPAPTVNSGSCSNCLLTVVPFDGYPEDVWDDDMELGATELYFALQSARGRQNLPSGLPHTNAEYYLKAAAQFASNYITSIYQRGYTDTLNLYDVSGLAHFELDRALQMAGNPSGWAVSRASIQQQFLQQVDDAISEAGMDPWGYGNQWNSGDTTSHGAGLSVMASEAYYLTQNKSYDAYAQRWLANILGANAWGSSFIVGDGTTFPNCVAHQVANLVGALNGTSGGVPVLWGAASEGPANYTTSGVVGDMILCPANGSDPFKKFNGNAGPYDASQVALYQDNVQSYSTTEPAIDLTATSFLMWSWRMSHRRSFEVASCGARGEEVRDLRPLLAAKGSPESGSRRSRQAAMRK